MSYALIDEDFDNFDPPFVVDPCFYERSFMEYNNPYKLPVRIYKYKRLDFTRYDLPTYSYSGKFSSFVPLIRRLAKQGLTSGQISLACRNNLLDNHLPIVESYSWGYNPEQRNYPDRTMVEYILSRFNEG